MKHNEQALKGIAEKRIKLSELRTDFGNPKRIERRELERLKKSLAENGDFGVFVVNENLQVLSGNQRVRALMEMGQADTEVLCKVLVGYTLEEQKRVLLEANATRGKYVLAELEEFAKGTSLKLEDFNVNSFFSKAEMAKQNFAQADEIKIIPLVIAESESEYDEFMELKKILGVKKNSGVIKKILTEKRKEIEND